MDNEWKKKILLCQSTIPIKNTMRTQIVCMRTSSLKLLSFLAFSLIPRNNALNRGTLSVFNPCKFKTNHLVKRNMASFKDVTIKAPNPHNFSWQQTMLRIKDPERSVPFYRDNFGFTLIHSFTFPQWYMFTRLL